MIALPNSLHTELPTFPPWKGKEQVVTCKFLQKMWPLLLSLFETAEVYWLKFVLNSEWQLSDQHLVGRPANKQEICLLLLKVGTSFLLSLILLVMVYFSAVFLFQCLSLPIPACKLVTIGVMISLELLQFKAIVPAVPSLPSLILRFEELRLCMG